jgi:lipid-A-disaccharide synthase
VSGERDKGYTRLILRWLSAPRLLISCGEPSGDLYGGELLRHLRHRLPGLEVFGLGGEHVLRERTALLGHVRDLAVVGLVEVVRHLGTLRRIFNGVLEEVDRRRPDLAVLVDYPSFNLRLARELKRRGVPVVYYISPQIWAWKGWRIREIRRNVGHMLVIFPFEQAIYERAGVPVTFVGHPLVDLVRPATDRAAFLRGTGLDPTRPVVAVLPGSRPTELRYNLPALAGGIRLLAERRPDIQFLLAIAPSLDPAAVRSALGPVPVTLLAGQTHAVLGAADLGLVVSGTATVEAALLGTPMIVVYRVASLTYALGRRLIRVPHAAMANLIAGREVVPELIQWDCTPARVAGESLRLLEDTDRLARMRGDLAQVARSLGAPGASERAAEAAFKYYLSLDEKNLDRKRGYM